LIDQRRWGKLGWQVLKLCIRDHDRHTFFRTHRVAASIGKPMITALRQKGEFVNMFNPNRPAL
jgi:hypothetical protein